MIRLTRLPVTWQFAKLLVVVSFISPDLTKKSVKPRDLNSLARPIQFGGANSVIICLRIQRPQCWGLIAGNPNHLALPNGQVLRRWRQILLDLSKKIIIVALKALMIPRFPSEIEGKRGRAHSGHGHSESALRDVNPERPQKVCHGCGAKQNHHEVEPTVPAVKPKPTRGVVKCVSENVEPDLVSVHVHITFSRGVGSREQA